MEIKNYDEIMAFVKPVIDKYTDDSPDVTVKISDMLGPGSIKVTFGNRDSDFITYSVIIFRPDFYKGKSIWDFIDFDGYHIEMLPNFMVKKEYSFYARIINKYNSNSLTHYYSLEDSGPIGYSRGAIFTRGFEDFRSITRFE